MTMFPDPLSPIAGTVSPTETDGDMVSEYDSEPEHELIAAPAPGLMVEFPSDPPIPVELPFQEAQHTWLGTDGVEWELSRPETGVFLVQEAIEGMHHPPMDFIQRQSPALPGSSFHGYRVTERPVVWALYIYSDDSSMHWVERDRALWKSLQPGREGVWTVTLPNGDSRQLRMRIKPTPQTFDRDPVRFGWKQYAVEAVADINPFWTSPTTIAGTKISWRGADDVEDFFNGDDKAPPFRIAESALSTTKSHTNDGDEAVWPRIDIRGPMQDVAIAIGDQEFTISCKLTSAQDTFTLITEPRFFSVTDNRKRNRIKDVTTWSFKPIPAGETVPISVIPNGDGGGTVELDVTPLYYRAW